MNRVKRIYKIEITNTASGQKSELWLPQIDDLILIKRKDLMRYFNIASSTLDAVFQSGKLKKYQANGMQKTTANKTGCYYNLPEFLSINEHEQPVSKIPSTFTLNLRNENNAKRSERKEAEAL